MEAERLVLAGLHALAESGTAHDIVAEAWQARALAQAIGSHLALCGPLELRSEARGLSEAGEYPAWGASGPRAARLTEVGDPRSALTALGELLGEVGIALVGVASVTDDEGLYWQCMEAIDAADEAGDRVRGMLRRLDVREQGRARPPDPPRGRAGPSPTTPHPTPRPAPEPGREPGREPEGESKGRAGREPAREPDREPGREAGRGPYRERDQERDRARDR
ncbi:hypothetical protein SNE510_61270 [Streptomyces sp. NE5-10]|nr:hypothetical protein SNE510_61270 [Streptomyces sp. NE5-10]